MKLLIETNDKMITITVIDKVSAGKDSKKFINVLTAMGGTLYPWYRVERQFIHFGGWVDSLKQYQIYEEEIRRMGVK